MRVKQAQSGDVYKVPLEDGFVGYFQFITLDWLSLNSEVIRVFKKHYKVSDNPSLGSVVKDEIDFHTHTMIAAGVKTSLWENVGHAPLEANADDVSFRSSLESQVDVSHLWRCWHLHDTEGTRVTKLTPEQANYDFGSVFPPDAIVERMQLGKFNMVYPDYEITNSWVAKGKDALDKFKRKNLLKIEAAGVINDLQSVTFTLTFLSGEQFGTEEERNLIYAIEDKVDDDLEGVNLNGHEFGEGAALLYVSGNVAHDCYKKVEDLIETHKFKKVEATLINSDGEVLAVKSI